MRRFLQKTTIWIALIAVCFNMVVPGMAAAQTTNKNNSTANNGQALEIAPPVIYLNADPGQSVKTQIFIRDISSGNLLVNGQVNDFISGGEDGTPKILLDGNDANNAYSLKTWIAPLPSLLLIPREIKTMTATVNVPKDASPGGHYGVIRFTSVPPSLEGSGVSLAASIGVLLLVTVSGDIKEGLQVPQFTVSRNGKKGTFFESGPIKFTEQFKNTGNVHVQPVGQIGLTDMFGKKIASVNVNLPPGNVLPGSTRTFNQELNKEVIGDKRLFGRYKAVLKVTYGTDKKTVTTNVVFWVIPYKLILIVIILLVAIFFGLRFMIKRYNRRIVAQAQKRNNK